MKSLRQSEMVKRPDSGHASVATTRMSPIAERPATLWLNRAVGAIVDDLTYVKPFNVPLSRTD